MERMLCFAHRGASGYAPENTLRAVDLAIDLGTDWVTVDVHRVGDELVVVHSERLEDSTSGVGCLWEMPLTHIRLLDAGEGESMPTLRDVLTCAGGRVGVAIEIRNVGAAGLVAETIREFVFSPERCYSYDHFLVTSFHHAELQAVRERDHHIAIAPLTASVPLSLAWCAEELDAQAIGVAKSHVTSEIVRDAKRCGVNVYAFTVDQQEDLDRMAHLGVDGIMTRFPDRMIAWRSARRHHHTQRV